MNKLNIFPGGHPRSLNDLDTLQKGTLDVLEALALVYSEDVVNTRTFLLAGLHTAYNPSTGLYSWKDGYVYHNGEVWRIPVGAGTDDDFDIGVYLRPTYYPQANNPVAYADASSHIVHAKGELRVFTANTSSTTLIQGASTPTDINWFDVPTAEESFAKKLQTLLHLNQGDLALIATRILGSTHMRLDRLSRVVYLRGWLTVSDAHLYFVAPTNYYMIATMPAHLQPARKHVWQGLVTNVNGWEAAGGGLVHALQMKIEPSNGSISVAPLQLATQTSCVVEWSTSYPLD